MKSEFLDEVKIQVTAGQGGSGCISAHREKYKPYGGPDGGDGGRGGSVWIQADQSLYTLNDFLHKVHFKAERGQHGMGDRKAGKNSEDLTVRVPVGTQVFDPDSGELLADLTCQGQRFLAARAGIGGRGNSFFATQMYRFPRFAEYGEPGEERWVKLVLKMIADVGLVGFPNAGKSTLLAAITAATPKIAPYPFTTLSPNLGVAELREGERCVVADIPGLIEGAHQGVGLGHKFLRHIERTRLLVHLLDVSAVDPAEPLKLYSALRDELRLYQNEMAELPQVVALNKIDLPDAQERLPIVVEALKKRKVPAFPISGVTGEGLDALLQGIQDELSQLEPLPPPVMEIVPHIDQKAYLVKKKRRGRYRVSGPAVERLLRMTDLENEEALRHLQLRMKKIGVEEELKRQGVQPGDTVAILDFEFEYQE